MVNLEEIKADLVIEYPCKWSYKIILNKDESICELIKKLNLDKKYTVKESNTNSKYASYELTLEVPNESYRLELFDTLKKNAKFVL